MAAGAGVDVTLGGASVGAAVAGVAAAVEGVDVPVAVDCVAEGVLGPSLLQDAAATSITSSMPAQRNLRGVGVLVMTATLTYSPPSSNNATASAAIASPAPISPRRSFVVALMFTADASPRQRLAHRGDVRAQARALGDNRGVDVDDAEALRRHRRGHRAAGGGLSHKGRGGRRVDYRRSNSWRRL